jgi:hypothetical protein
MGIFKSVRIEDRKKGKDSILELKKKNKKTLIIHYSCESFFNTNGRSPRITSICVKNRGNNITKTFSIHLQAQFHNKELCCLTNEDYDYLEKSMLKDFANFLKRHQTYNWVHWNMRDSSFGFEAISNRYRILGGHLKEIEDQFKFDLPEILGLLYTYDFEDHKPSGQLLNLAKRNKISDRDALLGKEEANCFESKDYLKLHMSTCRKVEIIDRILTLEENNHLKVKSNLIKKYGLTPTGIFEMINNHWLLFCIWSFILFIIGIIAEPHIKSFFNIPQ